MTHSYLASVCRDLGLEFAGHDEQSNKEDNHQLAPFNVSSNAEHELLLARILDDSGRPDLGILAGKAAAATPTHLAISHLTAR